MSKSNTSGTSQQPKEWWGKVSLDDVASCTATVSNFMNDPEHADIDKLLMALPLFILCGGNFSSFADDINCWKDKFKEAITTELTNGTDTAVLEARIMNWYNRQGVVMEALSLLPESYSNDISNLRECVEMRESDKTHAMLAIKKKKVTILNRPDQKH